MEGLIDNNVPLPSNVDEAAEEYAPDFSNDFASKAAVDAVRDAFKNGAEWLAQQGQTLDSLIWRDEDDKLFIEAFVDENKFKMADNVIIQVRKKQ